MDIFRKAQCLLPLQYQFTDCTNFMVALGFFRKTMNLTFSLSELWNTGINYIYMKCAERIQYIE